MVLGIIALFICMSITLSVAVDTVKKTTIPSSIGNTLYVGGTGEGNYTKIQDAIDNASDGDTIFVYSGTYYENIVVDKSINLIGEDKITTKIDGFFNDKVVHLVSPKVIIRNFRIQNSSYNQSPEDCGIYLTSHNNTIINNIITNNGYGIKGYNYNSISDNTICNNIILENEYCGVKLSCKSRQNNISNNIIKYHRTGISLNSNSNIPSLQNLIFNNNVQFNSEWGIYLNHGYENIIMFNNISNSYIGILMSDSENNIIKNCKIFNNEYDGINMGSSSNNTIINNKIVNNLECGIYLDRDFFGGDSLKNNIIRNDISDNKIGIFLNDGTYGNLIYNNIIKNNLNYEAYFVISTINKNRWFRNYWGRPRLLPYPIFGKIKLVNLTIPWIVFDWRPALLPHKIEGVI